MRIAILRAKGGNLSSLSFIHAADLHLDSPFIGLQQVDEEIARRLRNATFEAFDNLIQSALEHKVDFLLVAGDVYDSADSSIRAQFRFRDGLAKLASHGIPSYVIHGNHDPLDRWIPTLDWPSQVKIFQADDEQHHPFHKDGKAVARIHGISYPTKSVSAKFGRKFQRSGSEPFQIGLFHCNLNGDPRHGDYAPRTLDELRQCNLDYWALGHVHERKVVSEGGPFVAYPGNLQGRHVREAGARGAMLIRANQSGVVAHDFLPLDTVRWEHLKIGIENLSSVDALVSRVQDVLCADGRSLIARISLVGRGPLYRDLARDATGILSVVRERCTDSASPHFVWVERLENRTKPDIDLQQRAEREDFVGTLLRLAADFAPENVDDALKALWENSRAKKFLGGLEESDRQEILERAIALVSDSLLEDE